MCGGRTRSTDSPIPTDAQLRSLEEKPSQVVRSPRAAGRRLSRGPLLGESWLRSHAGRAREIHGRRGLRARRKTVSHCWRVSSGNMLAGKESSTVGLSPKKAGPTRRSQYHRYHFSDRRGEGASSPKPQKKAFDNFFEDVFILERELGGQREHLRPTSS